MLEQFYQWTRETNRKLVDKELAEFRLSMQVGAKELITGRKPNSFLTKYAHVPVEERATYEVAHVIQVRRLVAKLKTCYPKLCFR